MFFELKNGDDMKNLFVECRWCYLLVGLWFEIESWPRRVKRLIWNRGIKSFSGIVFG